MPVAVGELVELLPQFQFRERGRKLELVHNRGGYSTHRIGSRNLDAALAGDLDDDGRSELLLPSQDNGRLDVVKRVLSGSEVVHSVELGGRLSTNIAAFSTGGRVAFAFGTDRRELYVYSGRN